MSANKYRTIDALVEPSNKISGKKAANAQLPSPELKTTPRTGKQGTQLKNKKSEIMQ
jgi:hypothetical protein